MSGFGILPVNLKLGSDYTVLMLIARLTPLTQHIAGSGQPGWETNAI